MPWHKATAPVPASFVLVDTDGDRVADTYLPDPSNFIAGMSSQGMIEKAYSCHVDAYGHQHCFWYNDCGPGVTCNEP
jgi:hypothetical protein